MPGRLLISTKVAGSRESTGDQTMGMYKLTFPGSLAGEDHSRPEPGPRQGSKSTSYNGFRKAFVGHRVHNGEQRNSGCQQPMSSGKTSTSTASRSGLDQNCAVISEDDEKRCKEPVFSTRNVATSDDDLMLMEFASRARTRNCNTVSDDDSSRAEFASRASTRNCNANLDDDSSVILEFTSTRNGNTISEEDSSRTEVVSQASTVTSGNTISDDDSLLREFARRTSSTASAGDLAAQSMRHSTACCSNMAFRRELRNRLHVEPTVDETGLRRDSTSSFNMGRSFRRELEKEDRIESLALWEETSSSSSSSDPRSTQRTPTSINRNNTSAAQNATPHSWHAGDMAASRRSMRNNVLDTILRRKSKSSSFFNGFFSGLSFSSSRKPRKVVG